MTLNVNSLLCHQSYTCFDQWLRLESRGFCHKVALLLNYRHIIFDDKTKEDSFEYQVHFPIRLRP